MTETWPAEERFCHNRTAMGERAAKNVAARERADGKPLSPYRCPFAKGVREHWHVGPPFSMAELAAIARRIRERTGNGPGAATRKASK